MRVHQLGPSLLVGDAITYDMLEIARRLAAWELETRLFAGVISPDLLSQARREAEYVAFMGNPNDLLFYHYAAYAANVAFYCHSANRKVLVYHNITPAAYFRGYDVYLEMICRSGRLILSSLRGCELALADSEVSRAELVRFGFPAERTASRPPFVPLEALAQAQENHYLLRRYSDGSSNFLFVGRVAPNKAYEDLICIFHCYHHHINPRSRLFLVGSRFLPEYDRRLATLVEALRLKEHVIFTGKVSLGDLKTYYLLADLFLSASRHEGFCMPLVECMAFDIPIVALAAAAVPETLGEAGVLYHQMDYPLVAEIVHLVLTDEDLRQRIIQKQQERLRDFSPGRVEARLGEILGRLGVL